MNIQLAWVEGVCSTSMCAECSASSLSTCLTYQVAFSPVWVADPHSPSMIDHALSLSLEMILSPQLLSALSLYEVNCGHWIWHFLFISFSAIASNQDSSMSVETSSAICLSLAWLVCENLIYSYFALSCDDSEVTLQTYSLGLLPVAATCT